MFEVHACFKCPTMPTCLSNLNLLFVCFFTQGHDTTSAAIAWSIFLIGSHSEVQVRSTLKLDKQFVIREKSEMIDL